jgi:hypothetical protein
MSLQNAVGTSHIKSCKPETLPCADNCDQNFDRDTSRKETALETQPEGNIKIDLRETGCECVG